MPELLAALGTSVERTVFRKLAGLAYRSSYSHGGRYYALDEMARFDSLGLWSFKSVHFSAHGTLVDTARAFVDASRAGYFASELERVLRVATKDCLRRLGQLGCLVSEDVGGRQLWCSADTSRRGVQVTAREALFHMAESQVSVPVADELKATIVLFLGMLSESQRRVFAGLESLKVGPGGDMIVARMLDLDPATVAKGRHALLDAEVHSQRVRSPGGGRKAMEKKRPKSSPGSRKF